MSKKAIWLTAIVIIVLVAAAWYFWVYDGSWSALLNWVGAKKVPRPGIRNL